MKTNSPLINVSKDQRWQNELAELEDTITLLDELEPEHVHLCRRFLSTLFEYLGALKIDELTQCLTADDDGLILAILARAPIGDALSIDGSEIKFSYGIEGESVVIRAERVPAKPAFNN